MFSSFSNSASLSQYHKHQVVVFTPLSLTGCTLWLDQDSYFTDTTCSIACSTSGQVIKGWKDKSSSFNNFINTNGGSSYQPNSINTTLSSALFNQTYGLFASKPTLLPSGSSQIATIFYVLKASTSGFSGFGGWGYTGGGGRQMYLTNTSVTLDKNGGSMINSATNIEGAVHQVSFVTGSTQNGYIDNNPFTTNNSSVQFTAGANDYGCVGTIYNSSASTGSWSFLGNICEVIIYNSQLSSTDRTTVYNYLKTKYGTP